MLSVILYAVVIYVVGFVLWAALGLLIAQRHAENERLTLLAKQNPQPPTDLRKGYRNMALALGFVAVASCFVVFTA